MRACIARGIAALLVPLLLLAAPTGARAADADDDFLRAAQLREAGQLDQALQAIQRYRAEIERREGPGSPHLAQVLVQQGRVFAGMGRHAEAEQVFARALAIDEAHYGAQSPRIEISLLYLAGQHLDQGQPAAAEALYQRMLGIREARSGPAHTDGVVVLRALAALYRTQQRWDEAEALVRRTLALWKQPAAKVFGVDFAAVGHGHELQNLAALQVDRGDLAGARSLYEQALRWLEQDLQFSRRDSGQPGNGALTRVIECLDRLARLSARLDEVAAARRYEARAKALRAELRGEPSSLPPSWRQDVFEIG